MQHTKRFLTVIALSLMLQPGLLISTQQPTTPSQTHNSLWYHPSCWLIGGFLLGCVPTIFSYLRVKSENKKLRATFQDFKKNIAHYHSKQITQLTDENRVFKKQIKYQHDTIQQGMDALKKKNKAIVWLRNALADAHEVIFKKIPITDELPSPDPAKSRQTQNECANFLRNYLKKHYK